VLTKEGFIKGAHMELKDRQDATSRYLLAALLQCNEPVISTIRRELRRIVDVLVDDQLIVKVLREEVIKRDCLDGSEAEAACKRVGRSGAKAAKVTIKPAPTDAEQLSALVSEAAKVAPAEQKAESPA
jgi:hypothetical protein